MHRLALALFLLVTVPTAAVADPTPTPTPTAHSATAAKPSASAPADMYFGPFGMSPLSIRSRIGFLGRQYHDRTISDHDLLHNALDIEFALRKWRTAYPADPWLAPTFFHLEQLYQAVQTDEARKHARAMLEEVVLLYPDTKQGHLSRARLAAGFPPLIAETPLAPSPMPAASQAPNATDSAAPVDAPAPTAPSPQPHPTSSPAS